MYTKISSINKQNENLLKQIKLSVNPKVITKKIDNAINPHEKHFYMAAQVAQTNQNVLIKSHADALEKSKEAKTPEEQKKYKLIAQQSIESAKILDSVAVLATKAADASRKVENSSNLQEKTGNIQTSKAFEKSANNLDAAATLNMKAALTSDKEEAEKYKNAAKSFIESAKYEQQKADAHKKEVKAKDATQRVNFGKEATTAATAAISVNPGNRLDDDNKIAVGILTLQLGINMANDLITKAIGEKDLKKQQLLINNAHEKLTGCVKALDITTTGVTNISKNLQIDKNGLTGSMIKKSKDQQQELIDRLASIKLLKMPMEQIYGLNEILKICKISEEHSSNIVDTLSNSPIINQSISQYNNLSQEEKNRLKTVADFHIEKNKNKKEELKKDLLPLNINNAEKSRNEYLKQLELHKQNENKMKIISDYRMQNQVKIITTNVSKLDKTKIINKQDILNDTQYKIAIDNKIKLDTQYVKLTKAVNDSKQNIINSEKLLDRALSKITTAPIKFSKDNITSVSNKAIADAKSKLDIKSQINSTIDKKNKDSKYKISDNVLINVAANEAAAKAPKMIVTKAVNKIVDKTTQVITDKAMKPPPIKPPPVKLPSIKPPPVPVAALTQAEKALEKSMKAAKALEAGKSKMKKLNLKSMAAGLVFEGLMQIPGASMVFYTIFQPKEFGDFMRDNIQLLFQFIGILMVPPTMPVTIPPFLVQVAIAIVIWLIMKHMEEIIAFFKDAFNFALQLGKKIYEGILDIEKQVLNKLGLGALLDVQNTVFRGIEDTANKAGNFFKKF